MLERMTGGCYRSTPHRVRNLSGPDRLSFPFFLDPSWDARGHAAAGGGALRRRARRRRRGRWDGQSVHAWDGIYGDYLTAKVAKVFPQLAAALRD